MTFNEEKVREAINDLSEREQMELWNERCCYENCMDDYIYVNDPDEFLSGCKPSEVLSAVDTENYKTYDDWAYGGSIYGWQSFSYLDAENSPFDIDEIISWYCDNEGYMQTSLLNEEELMEDEEDEEEDE